jgi:fatty acid-binding protein DegV
MVQPKVPDAEFVVGRIGPVVGVHVGPGALGLTWIEREG